MQNSKIKYFLLLIIIFFIALGISLNGRGNSKRQTEQVKQINGISYVKIAGKTLKVDLALTPESQEQGLSGRKELKENEGMLFIFNQADKYSFWMKDMNFALDIIWISEDFKVVYIKKNALPESYPESFVPNQKAKYVLEVSASFGDINNLKEGDRVEFLSS